MPVCRIWIIFAAAPLGLYGKWYPIPRSLVQWFCYCCRMDEQKYIEIVPVDNYKNCSGSSPDVICDPVHVKVWNCYVCSFQVLDVNWTVLCTTNVNFKASIIFALSVLLEIVCKQLFRSYSPVTSHTVQASYSNCLHCPSVCHTQASLKLSRIDMWLLWNSNRKLGFPIKNPPSDLRSYIVHERTQSRDHIHSNSYMHTHRPNKLHKHCWSGCFQVAHCPFGQK